MLQPAALYNHLDKHEVTKATELSQPWCAHQMIGLCLLQAAHSMKEHAVLTVLFELIPVPTGSPDCRTELHFVRCVKPNSAQVPSTFDASLVLHQLRCCGVLEVTRIARAGYPTRYLHHEFADRYGILLTPKARGDRPAPPPPTIRHTCAPILSSLQFCQTFQLLSIACQCLRLR